MAETEPTKELREHLRKVKERLMKGDSGEALLAELALVHARLERLELQQKALELALGARDVLVRAEPMGELPASVAVEADHLLAPEDGFYNLEHDQKGRPYRWTGPGKTFRFRVYVDRSAPRRITASFGSAIDPALFPAAQCFADNAALETRYLFENEHHTLQAELPARGGDAGATSLVFALPRSVSPREMNAASSDDRKLGLAFSRLDVEPLDGTPVALARPKAAGRGKGG